MSTKLLSLWMPVMLGVLFACSDMVAQQPTFRAVVIASGCTVSSAGTTTFRATIGQVAIGRSGNVTDVAKLGFWYPVAPGGTSSVRDNRGESSASLNLAVRTAPNPFNDWTEIRFNNAASGNVAVRVYDQLGRLVKTVADDLMEAGPVAIRLDADELSSGHYMIEVVVGDARTTTVVTVVK